MHDRQDAAADAFGRPFARIGEGERLLGAQADAGQESADHQQCEVRRECAEDGEDAEEQKIELIDEPAAEPVGEFALTGGADGKADDGGAADERGVGCGEAGLDDERDERAIDRIIDDVAEISRGDERDDPLMQRRNLGLVQRIVDEAFYGLCHPSPPLRPLVRL